MASLLFAEAVLLLFFAVAQLLAKRKLSVHYLIFACCLTLSYVLLYAWAVLTGSILRVPILIGSDLSAAFLAAPVFYLAALSILKEGRRPTRRYLPYFVAPVFLAFISFLYGSVTYSTYVQQNGEYPGHFSTPFATTLVFLAILLMTAAMVGDFFMARRLYLSRQVEHRGEFCGQVTVLALHLTGMLILWSSIALRNDRLFFFGALWIGAVSIVFSLTRVTVFYATKGGVLPPRRTVARPEWDKTAAELTTCLTALMETSAPYRNPGLSLQKLARLLGVEPRRLSYHLRAHLSTSFRKYINDWRLEAVGRMLREEPGRSILNAALENGFNSKSSFNMLFIQKYGVTPREYRRQAHARRSERQPASS